MKRNDAWNAILLIAAIVSLTITFLGLYELMDILNIGADGS